jgi:hypothetical protein
MLKLFIALLIATGFLLSSVLNDNKTTDPTIQEYNKTPHTTPVKNAKLSKWCSPKGTKPEFVRDCVTRKIPFHTSEYSRIQLKCNVRFELVRCSDVGYAKN